MSNRDESISNADYGRLRSLIYEQSGIVLNQEKRTMLELRIKRRLRSLSMDSFGQYCEYLFSRQNHKEEIVHLLDVVTTNKTDFFREPDHFDYLVQKAVPDLVAREQVDRELLVWSAGCSTGEEPYTLAMVLSEYALSHPGFRFRVLATDLSTTVLAKAKLGVYSNDVVRPVSSELRRKYFMRSRDPESGTVRVVPELRQLVEFRRVNFMNADFGLTEKVHIVFCRNVIIYFDRSTQEGILQKLAQHLIPGGYAFLGHSETLHGMDLPLVPVAPALYRRDNARHGL
jgi:chemotaxis protein methyltransferase CheR